ncbi:helix-turn-helix domain-containing protein [Aliarcobacter cryaerophilus]|uniref:helix-turn-helix domain-containing protein n=1 Tax=Aliarcobacter cryaerophilus TaxID=28198 RepID=UPI0021B69D04|nr:helix-turn-helix domain-containing protein [Aliarcobacter cryaerophilus]MCT7530431.1 helix-turn-helix domain-containing protein [Aliarcobacter cryaerophilus]
MEELDIEEIHKNIGNNVAKYRKEAGLSQLDLSLKLGHKSVSIVASAERFYKGKHFNINHIFQIAHILNIDVCKLIK